MFSSGGLQIPVNRQGTERDPVLILSPKDKSGIVGYFNLLSYFIVCCIFNLYITTSQLVKILLWYVFYVRYVMYVCVCVCVQNQILKRCLTSLNSEFSFSNTSCLTVGMSPIDGLVLMWHIPTEPSSVQSQSRFCLSESLPSAVIFLIVKPWRGFSQLSFVYVLFAFNIFLIRCFCVVSSFEPPLDHNTY